ncbi:hypothetical protein [Leptospira levettii]|uniref:hypothetical protein n=1 Tax=Leptospira levettii TaxID=2023178 RepID=UPI00223D8851|nr:hypothetical protein [Leptospira levettii]MCW7467796.1 hypothetical protein [Leptospira levettii]MCW7472613.1 hypothetical protein [Leptospira levettii]
MGNKKKYIVFALLCFLLLNCISFENEKELAKRKYDLQFQSTSNEFDQLDQKLFNYNFPKLDPKGYMLSSVLEDFYFQSEDIRNINLNELKLIRQKQNLRVWKSSPYGGIDTDYFYPGIYTAFPAEIETKSLGNFFRAKERIEEDNYLDVDTFEREVVKKNDKDLIYTKKKYMIIAEEFDLKNYDAESKVYSASTLDTKIHIDYELAKKTKGSKPYLFFLVQLDSGKLFSKPDKECEIYNKFAKDNCLKWKYFDSPKVLFRVTFLHANLLFPEIRRENIIPSQYLNSRDRYYSFRVIKEVYPIELKKVSYEKVNFGSSGYTYTCPECK